VYELFNAACAQAVHAGDLLSIDETFYAMYHHVAFKYVAYVAYFTSDPIQFLSEIFIVSL
jgi:hypothetical protein